MSQFQENTHFNIYNMNISCSKWSQTDKMQASTTFT